jgi:hypothetical protein
MPGLALAYCGMLERSRHRGICGAAAFLSDCPKNGFGTAAYNWEPRL